MVKELDFGKTRINIQVSEIEIKDMVLGHLLSTKQVILMKATGNMGSIGGKANSITIRQE